MKKIITHGHCSARYKWPTWPDFLHLYEQEQTVSMKQYINLGKPGISNENIARDIVKSVLKFKDISHVYVMWGAPHRHDSMIDSKQEIENTKETWSMWDPDFEWTVTYNKNSHNKQTIKIDSLKTLESILYTQLFLNKHNIDYTMMIYDTRTLPLIQTKPYMEISKQLDWTKFKLYKDIYGLRDFAEDLYPEHFHEKNNTSDTHLHPLPYAHYKWVKDIMFKSDIEVPMPMFGELKNWKSNEHKKNDWMSDAKVVRQWENIDA